MLAVTTILATTGINPGVFAAGNVASVSSGGTIQQVFASTAPNGGKMVVSGVEFNVESSAMTETSFPVHYNIYFNTEPREAGNLYTADTATAVATAGGDATAVVEGGKATVTFSQPFEVASGEYFAVELMNMSSSALAISDQDAPNPADNNKAGGYINNNPISGVVMTAVASNAGTLPNDVTSINLSATKTTIAVGETIDLSAELNSEVEGRKRELKYTKTGNGATVSVDGHVSGTAAGKIEVEASYNTTKSNKLTIYIVDASIANSTVHYKGDAISSDDLGLNVTADTPLTEGAENGYTSTFSNNTNVGTGSVTVRGTGVYSGFEVSLPFTIAATEITSDDVNAATKIVTADGSVTINDLVVGGRTLRQGTDFNAVSSNPVYGNDEVTYTVTVTGINNYTGTVDAGTVTSSYSAGNAVQLSSVFEAKVEGTYKYTGEALEPVISLYNKAGVLIEKSDASPANVFSDIDVKYTNNTKAGTATVTLTGRGNKYAGTLTTEFVIDKEDLTATFKNGYEAKNSGGTAFSQLTIDGIGDVNATNATTGKYVLNKKYVYTGRDITFSDLALKLQRVAGGGKTTLVAGEDYTVTYKNNADIDLDTASAKLEIVGKGNYTGKLIFSYYIIPDFVRQLSINLNGKKYTVPSANVSSDGNSSSISTDYSVKYDGTAKTINPTVLLNEENLVKDTDYEITVFDNNTDAGTATAHIKGLGDYAGKEVTVTYTITPLDLSKGSASVSGTYIYNNGKEIVPDDSAITVKATSTGEPLVKDVDYTVKYSDNKNAGEAKVTVTGKGNYSGTLKTTFNILKLSIASASVNPANDPGTGVVVRYQTEFAYTGNPIVPDVVIYNNGEKVFDSTDTKLKDNATVTATNNIKVSNNGASLKIVGAKNLEGTLNVKFSITKRKFDNLSITVAGKSATVDESTLNSSTVRFTSDYEDTYTYASASLPDITIVDNGTGNTLMRGTDYTVSVVNRNASDNAMINIFGVGSYAGSMAMVSYKIKPRNIVDKDISITQTGFDTSDTAVPVFDVVDKTSGLATTLKVDKDYKVVPVDADGKEISEWSSAAGIHHMKVKGIGNYQGETDVMEYERGQSMTKADIALMNPGNSDVRYTLLSTGAFGVPYIGNNRPKSYITMLVGTETKVLKEGTDYELSYDSDSYNAGETITVTVNAKSGSELYYGSTKFKYTIRRLSFVATSGSIQAVIDKGKINDTTQYFCGDQGIVALSDGNTKESRLDYTAPYTYFYAHQGQVGGYDPLTPNPKLEYYALGKNHDPIVLTASDISVSPVNIDVNGLPTNRTALVSITGNGNYADTIQPGFTVAQSDLQNSTVSGYDQFTAGDDKDVFYTGFTGNPVDLSKLTLREYGAVLKPGTDYTISSIKYTQIKGGSVTDVAEANVIAPGYYTITYKGTGDNTVTPVVGNYFGEKTITFKVTAREFNNNGYSIEGSDMYYYTGNTISTGFTIKEGKITLTPDAGYDVSIYKGDQTNVTDFSSLTEVAPKEIGLYTVVFTGKNKYTGILTRKFKVVGDLSKDNIFKVSPDSITGTYSPENLSEALNNIEVTYKDSANVDQIVPATNYTATAADWKGIGTGEVTVKGNAETVEDDFYYIGSRKISNNMKGNLRDAVVKDAQEANGNIYSFNGTNIKPRLTVTYYGQELRAGTDYEIRYIDPDVQDTQDTTKVGKYDYVLYGKGNFEGQTDSQSYSVAYNLKNAVVQFANDSDGTWYNSDDYSKEITGDATANHPSYVRAVITLADGHSVTLKNSVDFDVVYTNDTVIGSVGVELKPIAGRSYNEKKVSYSLTGKVLTNANTNVSLEGAAEGAYKHPFTGAQQTPMVTVKYGSTAKVLTEGVDYTLLYGDNVNAGTNVGTVTIKGIGQYSGSVVEKFSIEQISLNDCEVSVADAYFSGRGVRVVPEITIKYGNYDLVVDKDYKVSVGEPNTNAEENVTISGLGNFKDTISRTVQLLDRDISQTGAVTIEDEKVYDGAKISTKDVVLKVDLGYKDTDGKDVYSTLTQGTEYTVSAIDEAGLSANVGSYTFVITAKEGSHFTGQITKTVSIVPKDISDGEIEASLSKESYDYTGSEVVPSDITAVYNTKGKDDDGHTLDPITMTSASDFDVSYANNTVSASKNGDNAPTVILTGKGNYTGARNITFNIGTDIGEKATVLYTDPNFTYNGKVHDVNDFNYSVKYKNSTLEKNVDYTVGKVIDTGKDDVHYKEEDVIHAGTKTVTLIGTGAFYGELKFDYHIKAKTVSKDSSAIKIVLKDFEQVDGQYQTVYNGEPATSEIEIYDLDIDKDEPIDATNWELYKHGEYENGNGYKNNTNVSASDNPAMVAITMKGDYDTGTDTLNQKFYIKGKSLNGLNIELRDAPNATKDVNADRYPYDWTHEKPIKPEVLVHDGSNTLDLVEGRDYSISYENNETIGTATVKLTGKGNYAGEIEKEFVIYASLENAKVTLKADEYYYLGYGIVPTPAGAEKIKSVKVGGVTLDPSDYIVTESSDNNYQTSGSLTIVPSTDGSMALYLSKVATKEYEITSDLSALSVNDPTNENFPNYEYTGSQIKPNFVVTQPDGSEINYDKDNIKYYRVTAGGDIATTELVEKGNYKAEIPLFKTDDQTRSLTVNFNITNPMINASDINMKKSYVYNGDKQKFTVAIYKGSNCLEEGKDYSITVLDKDGNPVTPVECGDYYLLIRGMGEFEGSEVNFLARENPEAVSIEPDRAHAMKVASVSNHQIYLEWNASNDVNGYVVSATKKGTDETVSYRTSSTNYTFTDLEGGTKYILEVKPFVYNRDDGNYYYGTPRSLEQRTRILSPTDVTKDETNKGKVTISWNPNAVDIDGYEVYRSSSINGTYSLAAVVPISYASYTDTQVTSGKIYYYRLRSYKKEANGTVEYSSYSQIVEAKAP